MSLVSANVCNVYNDSKVKKYYINNLKTYIFKATILIKVQLVQFVSYTTNTKVLTLLSLFFTINQTAMKYTRPLSSKFLNLLHLH